MTEGVARFARVTMLEPYKDMEGMELAQVVLRYGYEPARMVSGSYYGESVPISERAWEDGTGRPPKFIHGKPIEWAMRWDDPEYRSVITPDYVAHHYFGDWTIPVSQVQSYNEPERTYTAEKRRIATVWGGYLMEQRDRNIGNHWRSLRKIAPPRVPRVLIEPLDSGQRAIPGQAFDPWKHFAWEKDCSPLQQLVFESQRDVSLQAQIDDLKRQLAERDKTERAPMKGTNPARLAPA